MPCYFFSGTQYIRVTRGNTGPGAVDAGYPAPISAWNWGKFGAGGIDAALYSGPVDYFFKGNQYIRVTRGNTGPGSVDAGYPAPIANWNWGKFGADGIDAALYSGPVCYFFKGNQYIRVTRGNTGPGSVDAGYPAPISNWGWGKFGANGIKGALNSGPVCYFFSGTEYIRVTRGNTGPGTVDAGYPQPISNWGWGEFASRGVDASLFSGTDSNVPLPPIKEPQNGVWTWPNFSAGKVTVESATLTVKSTGAWSWTAALHDSSTFYGDNWAFGFAFNKLGHGVVQTGSLGATLSGPKADGGFTVSGTDPWLAANFGALSGAGISSTLHVEGDPGQLASAVLQDLEQVAEAAGKVISLAGNQDDDGDDGDTGADSLTLKAKVPSDPNAKPVSTRAIPTLRR